jgi:predicted 3-demethylubiquinone-9 3-methyltransferase (glyoxalase superfamily)
MEEYFMGNKLSKIQMNLWFDNQAEEAVRFYTSIFKNSGIGTITYYKDSRQDIHGKSIGSVMTIDFYLEGIQFVALNGGPEFKFSEAMSIIVNCDTQEEVDYYWEKLSDGGCENDCGWLKDKFGVSWQIVPLAFNEMVHDPDTEKSKRVLEAMYGMKKLDIKILQKAFVGE